MELSFNPAGHIYRVDGRIVPSVSELTRFLHREIFSGTPQQFILHAAERGAAVHSALNELEQSGTVHIRPDYAPYVNAYLEFLSSHSTQITAMDCRVHRAADYAGTFDRLAVVDGKRAILEFTTSSLTGSRQLAYYGAVLNLYRLAAEEEHGHIESLFLLQLKKDGTHKLFSLPVENSPAEACLCLHRALTAKKERSNANDK